MINKTKHFCVFLGRELNFDPLIVTQDSSSGLMESGNPRSPSNMNKFTCSICPGTMTEKCVFRSVEDLKKHLILGHKAFFIRNETMKEGIDFHGYQVDCYVKNCNFKLKDWEEAVIHLGIVHKKLWHALKHDKDNDWTYLLRKLFPDKTKRGRELTTSGRKLKMKQSELRSTKSDCKRKLEMNLVTNSPAKKLKVIESFKCSKCSVEYNSKNGLKHHTCQAVMEKIKKDVERDRPDLFPPKSAQGSLYSTVDPLQQKALKMNLSSDDSDKDESNSICQYCGKTHSQAEITCDIPMWTEIYLRTGIEETPKRTQF